MRTGDRKLGIISMMGWWSQDGGWDCSWRMRREEKGLQPTQLNDGEGNGTRRVESRISAKRQRLQAIVQEKQIKLRRWLF